MASFSRVTATEVEYPSATQMNGLNLLERVFKKKLGLSVRAWQNNTIIENKLERVHEEALATVPDVTKDLTKYGAVEALSRLIKFLSVRNKQGAFQLIRIFAIKGRSDDRTERDENELKDLIFRNSILLEEKLKFKDECEKMEMELSEKQTLYEEEKEMNAILSMRINYMITKKFLGDVTKVLD